MLQGWPYHTSLWLFNVPEPHALSCFTGIADSEIQHWGILGIGFFKSKQQYNQGVTRYSIRASTLAACTAIQNN